MKMNWCQSLVCECVCTPPTVKSDTLVNRFTYFSVFILTSCGQKVPLRLAIVNQLLTACTVSCRPFFFMYRIIYLCVVYTYYVFFFQTYRKYVFPLCYCSRISHRGQMIKYKPSQCTTCDQMLVMRYSRQCEQCQYGPYLRAHCSHYLFTSSLSSNHWSGPVLLSSLALKQLTVG